MHFFVCDVGKIACKHVHCFCAFELEALNLELLCVFDRVVALTIAGEEICININGELK